MILHFRIPLQARNFINRRTTVAFSVKILLPDLGYHSLQFFLSCPYNECSVQQQKLCYRWGKCVLMCVYPLNVLIEWVALLLCVWVIPASNLILETSHLDWRFCALPQPLETNTGVAPKIKPWPLPSIYVQLWWERKICSWATPDPEPEMAVLTRPSSSLTDWPNRFRYIIR